MPLPRLKNKCVSILLLLFLAFSLPLASQESLYTQASAQLQIIKTNIANLKSLIQSLENQILLDSQRLKDLEILQSDSNLKIADLKASIQSMQVTLEKDKELLARQESQLAEAKMQSDALKLSLSFSQSLNKWSAWIIGGLVIIVSVESIILFSK